MGVLSDLVGQLRTKLRSVQAEAPPADLEQAINDAVAAYAERRPRRRPLTLVIASGQEQVQLPEDWTAMDPDTWAAATLPPVPVENINDGRGYGRLTPGALRPALPPGGVSPAGYTFTIYEGYPSVVVISPAPLQQLTIRCDYRAMHEISDVAGETTVPRPDWSLVLLRAVYEFWTAYTRERAARPIQFEASGDGNSQRVKVADPEQLRALAEKDNLEFLRRIERPWGVRA